MSLKKRLGLVMLVAPHVTMAAPVVLNANLIRCDEVQTKVEHAGHVNLTTINVHIYDRYVSDARFCDRRQFVEPAFVATADSPQCLVGYRCVSTDERN